MTEKHVQRCPICFGTGTVAPGFYDKQEKGMFEYRPKKTERETCRACGGSGVVRS